MYPLESNHPLGTVIAQTILPNYEVSSKAMAALYFSGITPIRLFPDLKGRLVSDVIKFFSSFGITVHVMHAQNIQASMLEQEQDKHACVFCTVADQKPLPYTFIDLTKPSAVQVTAIKK